MGKVLEVTDLNIRIYDKDTPDTVVFDFDLSMDEGEIVGLVGESGSGKSMSALAIAGLLNRHDMEKRGKIMFEGRDLLTCPREELRSHQGKDIGIIFQEPMTSLNPVKKIGWQVEENLRIHTNMTPEERKLWYEFLREQPLRFMRQRPIDRFIVDFYCAKAKLVIELDGSQHFEDEGSEKDRERDAILEAYGIKVLRIPNNAVRQNFRGVCEWISQELKERSSSPA